MTGEQYLLFEKTGRENFDEWVHTSYGGDMMNQFIRDAIGLKRQGFKSYSAWALVGHIRFHHDSKYGPENPDTFKINNNNIAYMARFAMERAPELKGFFKLRELGARKKKGHAVVVPIRKQA